MFAFDNVVQPSPTQNMRYYHKFTVDEVHVLYVAYAKREYDELCSAQEGKYKKNILLNDRSKRVYDFAMKGSRSMDYIYNRDADVNYTRSSYCLASCCFTSLFLNNDLSCCRHCNHKEWTGHNFL